eukprot:scaffold183049_cov22-Tisochrysis_lutea.AAC.1
MYTDAGAVLVGTSAIRTLNTNCRLCLQPSLTLGIHGTEAFWESPVIQPADIPLPHRLCLAARSVSLLV